MPTDRLGARRVHFAAAKRHCALYGAAIDLVADQRGNFKMLKGTVQFPLARPFRKLVIGKLCQ
jgi:uncharacterized protein YdhG (YjbR/CyaY superfamily)